MMDITECEMHEVDPKTYGSKETKEVYCFPFLLRKFETTRLFQYLESTDQKHLHIYCQGEWYPDTS
jgi:hypothetical protein